MCSIFLGHRTYFGYPFFKPWSLTSPSFVWKKTAETARVFSRTNHSVSRSLRQLYRRAQDAATQSLDLDSWNTKARTPKLRDRCFWGGPGRPLWGEGETWRLKQQNWMSRLESSTKDLFGGSCGIVL